MAGTWTEDDEEGFETEGSVCDLLRLARGFELGQMVKEDCELESNIG